MAPEILTGIAREGGWEGGKEGGGEGRAGTKFLSRRLIRKEGGRGVPAFVLAETGSQVCVAREMAFPVKTEQKPR